MLLLPPYSLGTAAVAHGGTTVAITGGVLSDTTARELDTFVDVASNTRVFIRSLTDATHFAIDAWPGSDLSGASYQIEKTSPLRFAGGQAMADVQQLVDWLKTMTIIIPVAGDVPDDSVGEEGWYALKSNEAGWKLWLKDGGTWVEQGAPVGSQTKGNWNATDTFLINDEVFDPDASGQTATWRSRTINTNKKPKDNPDDWYLAAAPGTRGSTWTIGDSVPANSSGNDLDSFVLLPLWDVYQRQGGIWTKIGNIRGIDGGGVTIPLSFDATSLAIANPGSGKLRLNASAQNTATALAASNVDNRGLNFSAAFDTLGAGSSATKQIMRLYKASDQTKFLLFAVTAVNAGAGFYGLVLTPIAGSAASPFANGDALVATFAAVGDKGDTVTGPTGTSYRERPYDGGTTYVNNASFIDRVIDDGQTWTCLVPSVTGVKPSTDPTKWALAARGVDPSVIDAATAARDQAEAALGSVQGIQTAIDGTVSTVEGYKDDAADSAGAASTSASDAANTAATVEGMIAAALAVAAQAADDGDADDGSGTAATVDDGDADI